MAVPGLRRRLGLRQKAVLLLALILTLVFVALGYIADRTIAHTTHAALQERLSQARGAAALLDTQLALARRELESLARSMAQGVPKGDRCALPAEVAPAAGTLGAVLLADARGNTLCRDGVAEKSPLPAPYRGAFEGALAGGWAASLLPPREGTGPKALLALRTADRGTDLVVLLGTVPLDQLLRGVEKGPDRGPKLYSGLAVTDSEGSPVYTLGQYSRPLHGQHLELLSPFIAAGEPGVRVHRVPGGKTHVVAFAPLGEVSGGVILEEHDDPVLGIAGSIRRTLVILGVVATGLSSLGAWLYVRGIVNPILAVKAAAERIARGDLHHRLSSERGDEIGDVVRAFEEMRVQLLRLESDRRRWQALLEERVRLQGEELRRLLARAISAQEEERRRIAREIHDGAVQMLGILLLQMDTLLHSLSSRDDVASSRLRGARDYAQQTMEELRRVIMNLRPPSLDDLGLVAALREFASRRLGEAGLRMDFSVVGEAAAMDSSREVAIFRILQEAINNAVLHAEASRVALRLEFGARRFRATVTDDGKGFVLDEAMQSSSGVGIAGMLERAEIIGGHLAITTAPGEGTTVILEAPLGGQDRTPPPQGDHS